MTFTEADKVDNLNTLPSIIKILKDNNYNSIASLKDLAEANLCEELKRLQGIGNSKYNNIVCAIIDYRYPEFLDPEYPDENGENVEEEIQEEDFEVETVENNSSDIEFGVAMDGKYRISKYNLILKLGEYVLSLLSDESVPKYKVYNIFIDFNNKSPYPDDNIIYDNRFVYVKVRYIEKVFENYIDQNFVVDDFSNKTKSWLITAISFGNDNSMIEQKLIKDKFHLKKFSFNRIKSISYNDDYYLKFNIEKMSTILNKEINIRYQEPSIIINNSKTNLDMYFNKVKEDKEESVDNNITVYLNFCRRLSNNDYIVAFTTVNKINMSELEFDSVSKSGTYLFKDDINDGELMVPSNFDFDKDYIRGEIIRLLNQLK